MYARMNNNYIIEIKLSRLKSVGQQRRRAVCLICLIYYAMYKQAYNPKNTEK